MTSSTRSSLRAHTSTILLLLTFWIWELVPGGVATSASQQVSGTDNSLLTCFVPGPDGGSVPEEIRRVSIQPNATGVIWLPKASGFRRPGIEPLDTEALLEFLAPFTDMNEMRFISVTMPTGSIAQDPPIAPEELLVEGSGGFTVFRPDPDPLPDLTRIEPENRETITSFINTFGFGRCRTMANWTRLPEGYFPGFYAGIKCLNREGATSCSFPDGLQCEPDISSLAYINVLRWDCCWSYINSNWQWECGWRNVEIPIVIECICACQPNLGT